MKTVSIRFTDPLDGLPYGANVRVSNDIAERMTRARDIRYDGELVASYPEWIVGTPLFRVWSAWWAIKLWWWKED